MSTFVGTAAADTTLRTAYTPLLFPALLFDWLNTLTLTLTLTILDHIILEISAGSQSGVHVDFDHRRIGL